MIEITAKIEKCGNVHRDKLKGAIKQRRYRRSVLFTNLTGFDRDHIWIGSNQTMIDWYANNEFMVGKFVKIIGDVEKYVDYNGEQKQSVVPTFIDYI